MICSGMFHHRIKTTTSSSSQQGAHSSAQPKKYFCRYDAVTGEPMEAIDIPDGNGGLFKLITVKAQEVGSR